jgi:polyisoprenoid-binding protein YceI
MHNHKTSFVLAAALSFAVAPVLADNATSVDAATTTEWAIDATHAHVGFSVPHMVVSEVEGQFKSFSGNVALDEKDPTRSRVSFTAQVASIDTDNADRDEHLKGPEFFDAAKYPQIQFKSTKITKSGKGYKVVGELTIRGVTKPVTLDATLSEAVQNPWGKQVRASKLTGRIKRSDFGVSWNKALDKGGVLVGDEVTIEVKLELNK